jgi:opacity protein-like surface antigen
MQKRIAVVLGAALLAPVSPVAGQGFWAGLGLGTGMQQVGCDICRGDVNGGWTARLAMGGTLSRHVQLGAELHGWTDKTNDIRFTYYSIMPAVYWFPSARIPYYMLGGVGLVAYRATDGNETMSTSSMGLTVGLGYELRVSSSYAITPFVTYTGSFLANLRYERTDIANARFSLFQVGVGFTRRQGDRP